MLPNPGDASKSRRPSPTSPRPHTKPQGQGSTNTGRGSKSGLLGLDWIPSPSRDGSGCRTTTDQVAGPRSRANGSRSRRTDRGADAIPLRAPAAHLEPKGQGSTNTDGAQSAGVRRPDWITSVSRTARLPGPGVATHGSGVHQLLGPGSPPTDRASPVACSMHVVIWLVHASNGGCFRSFAR
jgi:hypothetical protein